MACSSRAVTITAIVIASVIMVGVLASAIGGSGDESGSTGTRSNSAEDIEKRRKGFHCLSAWDGGHNGLNELIKARLNDPGSFEMHATKIAPVTSASRGEHAIAVDFSAKNAFGGSVRHSALGTVDPDTCEATLVSVS